MECGGLGDGSSIVQSSSSNHTPAGLTLPEEEVWRSEGEDVQTLPKIGVEGQMSHGADGPGSRLDVGER